MISRLYQWLAENLRTRLTASYIFLIITPVVLISGFAYWHERTYLIKATYEKLESVITLKERTINNWLIEEKQLAKHLSNMPSIRTLSANLLTTKETGPGYRERHKNLTNILTSVLQNMDDLVRISILSNTGGREILSTDPTQIGKYHLTDSFFTLGRKETYVQKTYYSKSLNDTVMIVATPLEDQSNNKAGVLYLSLNPEHLGNILSENSGLGETGETYAVDIYNRLLLGTRHTQQLYKKVNSFGIDEALSKNNSSGIYSNHSGELVFGFYRWLEQPNIALLAEITVEEALLPLERFSYILLGGTLLIILAAIFIAFILARQISSPILRVAETAKKISLGDLSLRAPVITKDEIGTLSNCFNDMAGALQDSLEEKDRAYKKLQSTNFKLKAATSAKNIFLANMSHELRTPLNAIIGYSELLKEDAVESQQIEHAADLSRIHNAGQHLLSIINDILDIAKIEEGKIDLHYEPFSIYELVQSVENISLLLVKKNENTLEVLCSENIGNMVADMTRVRQSLFNLLSNAAKFTKNGKIYLSVTKFRDSQGTWVSFKVRDTGIGIAKDKIDKIFEQFSQADSSTTKEYGGTGLGLTLTKQFCDLMNGNISVQSEPGKGSEFIIVLPEDRRANPHNVDDLNIENHRNQAM
ncbi:sensor histidine kinase [Kaarinaea lacus]